MGEKLHEILMDLNRGRIAVDKAFEQIKSAMCEANAQPQLYDVPSNPEVYQWLRDMKYQTDDGAQEYIMYFDIDMPKILDDYFKWRLNRHVI